MTAGPAQYALRRMQPNGAVALGHGGVGPPAVTSGSMRTLGRPTRLPAATQVLTAKLAKSLSIESGRRRLALFVATCCVFAFTVHTEIAYQLEMWVSKTIAGIPQHYLLTAVTLLLVAISDNKYPIRLLNRPQVVFYLTCLMLVVCVGLFRNRNQFLVRADLYLIRWFFMGFLLMRLAIISGRLKEFLLVALISVAFTSLTIDQRNTVGGQVTVGRIASSDLWTVANLGIFMAGLATMVTWPSGILHASFCTSAFGLFIFLGGIRSSTRSLFIAQSVCFLLCMVALSRDPRMRGRGRQLQLAIIVLVLLGACVGLYLLVTGQIFADMTQLGTRFTAETSERHNSGLYRLREAAGMIEAFNIEEWIFGVGVGGMILLKEGVWMNIPHIALFGWLLKGGIFIFCVALWSLYIAPALSFIRAIMGQRGRSPFPQPILIVGPPLMGWASLTCLSGGIDIGSSFGLGFLAALWLHLADDERHYRGARVARAGAAT